MDQGTLVLVVLIVIFAAVAAFSFGNGTQSGPLATPPNPNAEFGVVHPERKSSSRFENDSSQQNDNENEEEQDSKEPEEISLSDLVNLERANAKNDNPDEEYIRIKVSSKASSPINMTGWTVSSLRGVALALGNVTNLPGTYTTPHQDLLLVPAKGTVNVITGHSPRGENFRANKCVRYFTQFRSYTPSFSLSCPSPNKEPGQEHLSDECYQYLKRLTACKIPLSLPLDLDNECRDYITEKANYTACVDSHKYDSDFYKNDWWVYLNRSEPIWSDIRETITLKNAYGEVVDEISYD